MSINSLILGSDNKNEFECIPNTLASIVIRGHEGYLNKVFEGMLCCGSRLFKKGSMPNVFNRVSIQSANNPLV